MANVLQTILDSILGLLKRDAVPDESSVAIGTDCSLPPDLEILPEVPHDNVIEFSAQAAEATFSAQAAGCSVTIRPELGTVNLRTGPGVQFEPPYAKTSGGNVFELVGANAPDADGLRWYSVKVGDRNAWVRSDVVIVPKTCVGRFGITEKDVTPITVSPPTQRFPPPVDAVISQGYRTPAHPGLDLAVATGRAIIAPTAGVCIRRVDCTKCTKEKPNRKPNAQFQCPDTWKDPAWGFGYGNFIVVRFDYNAVPKPLREEMDRQKLTGGYAYVLFAHLSRLNVSVGQRFQQRAALGATGNTGCSSAPHLHFEVRIGKDENVDGRWSLQKPVHPNLMFEI